MTTKYWRVTMGSASVSRVREAGTANPGSTSADVAALTGLSGKYATVILGMLHKAGELVPVKITPSLVRWWPADMAAREIERLQADRRKRKQARQRQHRKLRPYSRADRIRINSRAALRMLELIEQRPGIRIHDMVTASGYALSHTKNVLAVLTTNKLAWPVPDGSKRCWHKFDEAMRLIAEKAAAKNAPKPKKQRPRTQKEIILELAGREGGASSADIMLAVKESMRVVSRHCPELVRQGKLHKAIRPGARARWFDTAERAKAWERMPPLEPNEWVTARAWKEPAKPAKRTTAVDAPVVIKTKATDMRGKTDTTRARVIPCPSTTHDSRYQVAPGAVVFGEFSRQWQELRGGK